LILVTGAAGHLGTQLVRHLHHQGLPVCALIHRTTPAALPEGVPVRQGNVLDPASLDTVFHGVDVVMHTAGKINLRGNPDGSVERLNVQGAHQVAQACLRQGVRRLLHTSSIQAFALDVPGVHDETSPRAGAHHPVYDRTKAAAEVQVLRAVQEGLDAVILNPSGLIGPPDPEPSPMGKILTQMARGRLPVVLDGAFDAVDVRDVAEGFVQAMHRGRTGENYILAGQLITLRQLAEAVGRVIGRRRRPWVVPFGLAQWFAPYAERLALRMGWEPLLTPTSLRALDNHPVSTAKARAELGFTTRPLEHTLRDTLGGFHLLPYTPPGAADA